MCQPQFESLRSHSWRWVLICLASAGIATRSLADEWRGFAGPTADYRTASTASMHPAQAKPVVQWQRELGDGMSAVVADDTQLYVCFLRPFSTEEEAQPTEKRKHQEAVVCLDRETGVTQWSHVYDAGWQNDQQTFDGRVRAPQATPLILGNKLITLGFSGKLRAIDRNDGKLLWQYDVVTEYDAPPVQFGYSASPIAYASDIIALVGGKKGGLVRLRANDGSMQWNVPCEEASYATPVQLTVDGTNQIAFCTQVDIVGVDPKDGNVLWRYPHPQPGLTNVPTPIVLPNGELIVSGQGISGTEKIRIERSLNGWVARRIWKSNAQFFYCNGLLHDTTIIACDGSLLVAIDTQSGQTVGRWRGYQESNLVSRGDELVVMDGDGSLSILLAEASQLTVVAHYDVMHERCWTPPTIVDSQLFCRGGKRLMCIKFVPNDASFGTPIASRKVTRASLKIKPPKEVNRSITEVVDERPNGRASDGIQRIIDAYQAEGVEVAWNTYMQLRNSDAEQLTFEQREELFELAIAEQLNDFAYQIVIHAVDDFKTSKDAKQWLETVKQQLPEQVRRLTPQHVRAPSAEIHSAENGLVYLEFGIRNAATRRIETRVQGPARHPFSYGIPFSPGQTRIEKWPVGTRLYLTENGIERGELLEVRREDAGKVRVIMSDVLKVDSSDE